MNVADVEAMEWYACIVSIAATLGGASLAVFLCFCELHDDRYTTKVLSSERNGCLDRLFIFELNVADPVNGLSNVRIER